MTVATPTRVDTEEFTTQEGARLPTTGLQWFDGPHTHQAVL